VISECQLLFQPVVTSRVPHNGRRSVRLPVVRHVAETHRNVNAAQVVSASPTGGAAHESLQKLTPSAAAAAAAGATQTSDTPQNRRFNDIVTVGRLAVSSYTVVETIAY